MRLTLAILGWTWDLSLEPTADDEGNSLDGGTTSAYPISFTAWPQPEDAPMPQRTPAWDEPEE